MTRLIVLLALASTLMSCLVVIENCSVYDPYDGYICAECYPGYAWDPNSGLCVAFTAKDPATTQAQ